MQATPAVAGCNSDLGQVNGLQMQEKSFGKSVHKRLYEWQKVLFTIYYKK